MEDEDGRDLERLSEFMRDGSCVFCVEDVVGEGPERGVGSYEVGGCDDIGETVA